MSVIAGIFSLNPHTPVPRPMIEELRALICRNPAAHIDTFEYPACFLAKWDLGAYDARAHERLPGESAIVLAGHPHFDCGRTPHETRTSQTQRLAGCAAAGEWSILRRAQGLFCAAFYDAAAHRLSVMTDKVGGHAMFCWAGRDYVVFASAFRIMEAFSAVPKRLDVRGAAEAVAFGYPLGDRTGYAGIVRLRGGEIAQWAPPTVSRRQYWRWDEIRPSPLPEADLVRDVHGRFMRAVARRAGADNGVVALLSGGLDSRSVVGALRALGKRVWTWNFSFPDTPDKILSEQFAAAAGTSYSAGERIAGQGAAALLAASLEHAPRPFPIERPRLLWAGDGGSVGLGHVYVFPESAELLKAGKVSEAIEFYNRELGYRLPDRLFRPRLKERLAGLTVQSLREELEALEGDDPVRKFHIFLVLNDQRWHISSWFEDIDRYGFEPQEPFLDGDFLEGVMSVPAERCLGHSFYNKWLCEFPPAVTAVPWQAYPGHEPCPLPIPDFLARQWSVEYNRDLDRRGRADLLRRVRTMSATFPSALLDSLKFRAAVWADRAGLRDYAYVMNAALLFHRYWTVCGGDIDWETLP